MKYYFRSKTCNFLSHMICHLVYTYILSSDQNRKSASSNQDTISFFSQASDEEDQEDELEETVLIYRDNTDLRLFKKHSRQQRDIVTYNTLCVFWPRRDNQQEDSSLHLPGNVETLVVVVGNCEFQTQNRSDKACRDSMQ